MHDLIMNHYSIYALVQLALTAANAAEGEASRFSYAIVLWIHPLFNCGRERPVFNQYIF